MPFIDITESGEYETYVSFGQWMLLKVRRDDPPLKCPECKALWPPLEGQVQCWICESCGGCFLKGQQGRWERT